MPEITTLRPLQLQDIKPIVAWLVDLPLMQRYGLTTDRACHHIESALADSQQVIWVAENAHAVMGVAWCILDGAFGRSPYLRLIAIHPTMTGQGIGGDLLHHVEAQLSDNHDALFLLVSGFNTQAQRFYAHQGYTQVGTLPGYVLPDVTEHLYWKQLGAARATITAYAVERDHRH